MSHVSDFTKDARSIITDLINFDNPDLQLPADMVDYSNPIPMTGNYRNTDLTVTPRPGSGYTGSTNVFYDRLDITAFALTVNGMEDIVFDALEHSRLSHLIPQLNLLLGINLTDADYVDIDLPSFNDIPNEELSVTVAIRPSSLIYIGNLTIKIKANPIMLNEVVAITYLTGLQYPEG